MDVDVFEQLGVPQELDLGNEHEEEEDTLDEQLTRMDASRAAMTPNRSTYGLGVTIVRSSDVARNYKTALDRIQRQGEVFNPILQLLPPVACTGCGKRLNFLKLHRLLQGGMQMREAMDEAGGVRICCSASMMEDPYTVEIQKSLQRKLEDVDVRETFDNLMTNAETLDNDITALIAGKHSSVNHLFIPGLRDPLFDYNGFIIHDPSMLPKPNVEIVIPDDPEIREYLQQTTMSASGQTAGFVSGEGGEGEMESAFSYLLESFRGGTTSGV
jgi:DNA-directed RNA polymerase subunit N (RpoN/RPB10)